MLGNVEAALIKDWGNKMHSMKAQEKYRFCVYAFHEDIEQRNILVSTTTQCLFLDVVASKQKGPETISAVALGLRDMRNGNGNIKYCRSYKQLGSPNICKSKLVED